MAKRRVPEEKAASPEEVIGAVEALTTPQLLRLKKFACYRVQGLGRAAMGRDDQDLFNDSIAKTLKGDRSWNKDVSFDVHLFGVMRSISSHWKEQFEPDEALLESDLQKSSATGQLYNPIARVASTVPDPEESLVAKGEIDRIVALFADDLHVSLIIEGLREGNSGKEIREKLGISERDYESALKRMRKKIRQGAANVQ
jgi:DNA-directed RNA polymerase specialized sigma24 family protein